MPRFSEQELDKLLKTMPPDLKTAVFSEETAYSIQRICERNKIEKNSIPNVATLVGNVLIGLSPPEEFPKKLQEATGIDETKAQRITKEANRLIFYPVQKSLGQIYGKTRISTEKEQVGKTEGAEKPKAEEAEAKKPPSGPDAYREAIEGE